MKIRLLLAIGQMSSGGSETQFLRLLQSLDRTRYQPELFVIKPGGELHDRIPADVPVHLCQAKPSRWTGIFPGSQHRAIVRDIARLLAERNIDLIVDRTFQMTLLTSAAVRKRPTPRISVIVSDPFSAFDEGVERFARIKRRLLHHAYAEATIAAVVSEELKARAARFHNLPLDRFSVCGNLFDVDAIQSRAAQPLSEKFARRDGVKRIVAVGRLHSAKAYDVLIDAVAQLRDSSPARNLELLIVGDGPERVRLEQQIADHDLRQTVRLIGFQENPLAVIASADVYCLSSRFEGLPNALIEALIVGVPVVATDCHCGPREILEDGKWGALVPVADAAALSAALGGALDHPGAFEKRAISAQQAIAKRYSLETGLQRFDALAQRATRREQG